MSAPVLPPVSAHGSPLSRRQFLQTTTLAGTTAIASGLWVANLPAAQESKSPNEKLNIGIIGTQNRAGANISGVKGENIVAVCDIDDDYLDRAGTQFPQAKKFHDFRKLIEQSKLDAVVVSTPDHIHAPASVMAMKLGLHCYCEKPVSHSVYEARVCAEVAAKYKVATQMGTQIHAGDNYRRVVELIQSGAIGPVRECHVWEGKTWSGGERPKESHEVPAKIHWDLWLGPAPFRPFYKGIYMPANWRRWWDFGSGTLGDMGCHYLDLPFWALKLKHPLTAEAQGPAVHPETTPPWNIITWEFPARDTMPATKLLWYDGGKRPDAILKEHNLPTWGSAVLFIGDKGLLLANYGQYKLFPEKEFAGFKPPPQTIPNSIGHYQEWIKACKTGSPTTCNFDYSGALTETVLLGTVAYRVGKKLDWDAANLKATNCPEAAPLIRREYRSGWTL